MGNATLKTDPFAARDTFDTGSGKAGIYRLSKLARRRARQHRRPALLDSRAARIAAAQLRRLRGDRSRCESARRLECGGAGAGRNSVQAGPRRAARFHRRALRRRPGRDARRHEAARRRSEENQPARAGRPRDRPLGASRLLQLGRRAGAQHRHGVRPQPRALRVPALGPEGVQQFPRRAAGHRHRPPGESRIPGQGRVPRQGSQSGRSRFPIRSSAPTATPR